MLSIISIIPQNLDFMITFYISFLYILNGFGFVNNYEIHFIFFLYIGFLSSNTTISFLKNVFKIAILYVRC